MALDVEEVVDGRMDGEEPLRGRGRFEPLHLSLSSSHRLMCIFCPIVLSQALRMLSREGKQTDRGAVGAEFIGYNRRRREALLLQEFPHQPNCRPSVPAGLNQEIQDFALTVHGTPEIELPPSNYDDHLVQVPAFGRSWPPTLNPPRIGPTEFQDPSSNCLIRDVETTLGKQVLNVPIAQRETAIEPDGMLDDDRWKAVTTVGYLAHPETLKHRPCRSHAVNVTMPSRRHRRGLWERAPKSITVGGGGTMPSR